MDGDLAYNILVSGPDKTERIVIRADRYRDDFFYFSKLYEFMNRKGGKNPEQRGRDVVKYRVLGYVPSTKVLSLFLFTKFCH